MSLIYLSILKIYYMLFLTFSNFPVGEYLPLQVVQLYATGTDAAADNNCLAIW